MKTATQQLIEQAERLVPTGFIGDGTVAHFHELATRARIEQGLAPALDTRPIEEQIRDALAGTP